LFPPGIAQGNKPANYGLPGFCWPKWIPCPPSCSSPPVATPVAPAPRPPGPQAPRPPGGWYVACYRHQRLADPDTVLALQAWGVREHFEARSLLERGVLRALLTRAALGVACNALHDALLDRTPHEDRPFVAQLFMATTYLVLRKQYTPSVLAKRLHMSESTLRRRMERCGLVSPGRFMQRTRAGLALLVRTHPARRREAWKALGFSSPADCGNSTRRQLGRSLRQLERMGPGGTLACTLERLVARGSSTETRPPPKLGGYE
jgi:AraC-like DNA-binding protein